MTLVEIISFCCIFRLHQRFRVRLDSHHSENFACDVSVTFDFFSESEATYDVKITHG